MKNADGLDVAARRTGPGIVGRGLRMRAAKSASTAPGYTLRRIDHDRDRGACLSKIAHNDNLAQRIGNKGSRRGKSGPEPRVSPQPGANGHAGAHRRGSTRQIEFPRTVEADFVRAAFDREHAAQVTVAAVKNTQHIEKPLHRSIARCRRSQLPLASSHSRRERTLARAKAMAQSAAP